MQTGASALLAAAGIATLYGLVHFFDLFRREPTVSVEPPRVEFEPVIAAEPQPVRFEPEPQPVRFEPDPVADLPARQNVRATLARIEEQLTAHGAADQEPPVEMAVPEEVQLVEPVAVQPVEPVEDVEPAAPEPVGDRPAKAPRKASSRRSSTSKKAKVVAPAPVEDVPVVEFAYQAEPAGEELDEEPKAADEQAQSYDPAPADEPSHPPLAPLFEPEPFVRQQQRSMFGRKAGRG